MEKKTKSVIVYLSTIIFTLIINSISLFVTIGFIESILHYFHYFKLYTPKPVVFPPFGEIFSMDLMANLLLLLIIEFVVVCLLRKKLNTFFKIDNLFTIKKFIILALIIIGLQMTFSLYLWNI